MTMEKKMYVVPSIELVMIEEVSVITTSPGGLYNGGTNGDGDDTSWGRMY